MPRPLLHQPKNGLVRNRDCKFLQGVHEICGANRRESGAGAVAPANGRGIETCRLRGLHVAGLVTHVKRPLRRDRQHARHAPEFALLAEQGHFTLKPFYSTIGRPSIDPELMMRMLIVGYCMGIRSERRLCEEVHLNLAYRWFCRLGLDGKVPDHSTFSRNRHGRFRQSDILRHLFETVVERCLHEGLVGGEGFAVDASLIAADANKQRSVPGEEWQRRGRPWRCRAIRHSCPTGSPWRPRPPDAWQ